MRVLNAAPGPRLLPQLGSADTPGADAWTLSDNPSADPVAPSFRLTVDVHAGLELRQSNDLAMLWKQCVIPVPLPAVPTLDTQTPEMGRGAGGWGALGYPGSGEMNNLH